MTSAKSQYEFLGVTQSADAETLRRAFRRLSKELHPDTTSLPMDEAAYRFQEVCEAYELLSDPIQREVYDKSLDEVSTPNLKKSCGGTNISTVKSKTLEVRRTLSGGEWFSLLLLVVTLLISLLLALGFAFAQGRELQSLPSWLIVDSSADHVITQRQRNVSVASRSNTVESTFVGGIRILAD